MLRIAILLFDAVDLIDVAGPYEVLLTANRLTGRRGDPPPFEVTTAGAGGRQVRAHGGLGLVPDADVDELEAVDVLIVPGAIDVDGALADPRLARVAAGQAARGAVVMSICTGAFVLAAAGLLDGRPFTTHFEDLADLAGRVASAIPDATVRWIDDGQVITAGGMTCGIAAALHLVERTVDRDLAEATARQMDYEWTPVRATAC